MKHIPFCKCMTDVPQISRTSSQQNFLIILENQIPQIGKAIIKLLYLNFCFSKNLSKVNLEISPSTFLRISPTRNLTRIDCPRSQSVLY